MRGVITLVFDDGYEAVYQHVVPLLNELSMPGVFALPLDTAAFQKTVPEPVRPWTEWLSIRQHGHELAAHSVTHADLRSLSPTLLTKELQEPREKLGATTFVYPGGAVNPSVRQQTQEHYTAARTTRYGLESLPPRDPWQLTTVDYTKDNFNLVKANLRALWAALTNSWLIETYHFIDISESTLHHSVPLSTFKNHLAFIKKLPMAVKTIHDVIGDSHHQE